MHEGGPVTNIVKVGARRRPEPFDKHKLQQSIVAACLSAGAPIGQAESIARSVAADVAEWLQTRPEVTSHDLRRIAAKRLRVHHPDAGYLYEQHRSTL